MKFVWLWKIILISSRIQTIIFKLFSNTHIFLYVFKEVEDEEEEDVLTFFLTKKTITVFGRLVQCIGHLLIPHKMKTHKFSQLNPLSENWMRDTKKGKGCKLWYNISDQFMHSIQFSSHLYQLHYTSNTKKVSPYLHCCKQSYNTRSHTLINQVFTPKRILNAEKLVTRQTTTALIKLRILNICK